MSDFAKRHYEAIAETCQEYRRHCEHFNTAANRLEWQFEFEKRLADLFASDNGRFNRERFLAACRPGANVRARTNYKLAS